MRRQFWLTKISFFMGLSGRNLFNILSNSGIVQTKIYTPKILKIVFVFANERTKGAFLLVYSIRFKNK